MPSTTLKIDLRREKIMEALARDGRVSLSELSSTLGTTPVTIRSDLTALEREGLLVRVHGGAVPVGPKEQFGDSTAEKCLIGKAFAGLVREGDRLFINSGTTSQAVAAALDGFRNLSVVTNAPAVAQRLSGRFPVVLLGGNLNAGRDFTFGEDALNQLERYQADWAVLSVDSISAREGVTLCHPEETDVSRHMLLRASRGVIAADHTKIGRTGFVRFCDASAPLALVTGKGADAAQVNALRETGVEIILA